MERVIVIPDLQVPYHDRKSLKAVEMYMQSQRWDEIIYLGDFMDFDQISRWTEGTPGEWKTTLKQDYKIGNAILDRHESILGTRCKKTFILGNHDIRPEKLVEKLPQLKGQIEIETTNGLNLIGRGYQVVRSHPDGEIYKKGKAIFTHGIYTSKYHAAKMADVFGMPVYYGHVHDVQAFSRVSYGDDRTIEAHSLGCLCKYKQEYLKGPTNWQQAFGVFYFQKSGYYNMYCVRIFKHKFTSPEGVMYAG